MQNIPRSNFQNRGVLTIAHSKMKYARQALNLARSIRLHSPGLPLAVATDLDEDFFKGLYNHVIPWDFSIWKGLVSKLEIFQITPFRTTLYLDSDCITVASLENVFAYFEGAKVYTEDGEIYIVSNSEFNCCKEPN